MEEQRGSTERLATWVAAVELRDLPDAVLQQALRSFVNIVGCAIGGARHEIVDTLDRALMPFAGPATSTLIGRTRRTDMFQAAELNCVASAVHTFDDTHAEAVVHPSGPVASALLALAEARPCHGSALLLSFTIGVETLCRLGKAIAVPPAKSNMSWLQTAIAAPVAVALAAGKLMGLDRRQLVWAIGIAAAQASGLRCSSGSMWSRVAPGEATRLGLKAALLASHGLTGGEGSLEGQHGFGAVFSHDPHWPALDEDLGHRFEILANTFKPYPCGIVVNPVVDACLQLSRLPRLRPDQIQRIQVRVNPLALTLTDRRHPRDAIQAQVSVQHWAAVVLIDGTAGLPQLAEARIHDPMVVALRDCMEIFGDVSVQPSAADVDVTLRDGSMLAVSVVDCIGSSNRPMSDQEIDAKFHSLARAAMSEQHATALLAQCRGLATMEDAGSIASLTRAGWQEA